MGQELIVGDLGIKLAFDIPGIDDENKDQQHKADENTGTLVDGLHIRNYRDSTGNCQLDEGRAPIHASPGLFRAMRGGVGNTRQVALGQIRVHREADNSLGRRFGYREVSFAMAEVGKCGLQMKRLRIVDSGWDPMQLHLFLECVPIFNLDRVLGISAGVSFADMRSLDRP